MAASSSNLSRDCSRDWVRPVLPDAHAWPFSVDTWRHDRPHCYLSHAHKDHLVGLEAAAQRCMPPPTILCTAVTRELALLKCPRAACARFQLVEEWQVYDMEVPGRPGQSYRVIPLPANHCPGSVMFLFRSDWFGTILHTGDCRLTPDVLQQVQAMLQGGPLDLLYLDCSYITAWQEFSSMPAAVSEVIAHIERHPRASRIVLCCATLGTEPVLQAVADALDTRVHMPRPCRCCCGAAAGSCRCERPAPGTKCDWGFESELQHWERCRELQLLLPDAVTDVPGSRCVVRGAMRGAQRRHAEELVIKVDRLAWFIPTTAGSADTCPAPLPAQAPDASGVYHVAFNMHSSAPELERALRALAPRATIAFTGHMKGLPEGEVEAVLAEMSAAAAAAALVLPPLAPPPPVLPAADSKAADGSGDGDAWPAAKRQRTGSDQPPSPVPATAEQQQQQQQQQIAPAAAAVAPPPSPPTPAVAVPAAPQHQHPGRGSVLQQRALHQELWAMYPPHLKQLCTMVGMVDATITSLD